MPGRVRRQGVSLTFALLRERVAKVVEVVLGRVALAAFRYSSARSVRPEDFIISPDPAPPSAPTGRRPFAAGDVLIVAALPDPTGADLGRETVTILNTTDSCGR